MQFIKRPLFVIYVATFLFSVHLALTAYVNSSFLGQFVSNSFVGVVFSAAAIFTIWGLVRLSKILKFSGNHALATVAGFLSMLSLVALSTASTAHIAIPIFILYLVANSFLVLTFDIFIENYSADSSTGKARGLYLTTINLAWVLSPIISGLLVDRLGYGGVYKVAALFVLAMLGLIFFRFKNFQNPAYEEAPLKETIIKIRSDKNIRNVIAASFMLQFFYSVMVIYTPIYLHAHLGYSWDDLGVIFTIMLLPFVLFEFPLGRIADKFLGEKEIMTAGFIVIAASTALIAFIGHTDIAVWGLILFMTRVGASAVEVMTESYFFKHVGAGNAQIISFYRSMSPFAYVVAPLFSAFILWLLPFNYLYWTLGSLMFLGIIFSLSIKDTK